MGFTIEAAAQDRAKWKQFVSGHMLHIWSDNWLKSRG